MTDEELAADYPSLALVHDMAIRQAAALDDTFNSLRTTLGVELGVATAVLAIAALQPKNGWHQATALLSAVSMLVAIGGLWPIGWNVPPDAMERYAANHPARLRLRLIRELETRRRENMNKLFGLRWLVVGSAAFLLFAVIALWLAAMTQAGQG